MLYIFHVDTGTTITFDIKFALQSVAQLKEAIERECGVVASQQVLLMSGGESLEPDARVCSYSAGTDTNPIYLFSKAAIESHIPPTPSIDYGSDVDLQSQIDASLAMPATYQTLVARAHLAQQCCGLAREQTRICERLVHDQHLQQQGWAAVVANLEDITQMFRSRVDLLQQSFSLYLAERQQHMDLLENFNADLEILAKIPILPALRAQAEGILSPDDQQPSQSDADSANGQEVLSLFCWISAKDNQSSLEQLAEHCSRGLEQFDERVMEALKAEVNAAVDAANKQDMKEIKGLGERLFALEQLMMQTKRLVHEQGELAQGFLQNQNRANNLGDASVLPDLCTSHRRQLLVMLQNHNQLRDIRRRCTKAKEELSVNIYHRLKWIMYVENKMMEVDSKLVIYHESLKRLRKHLDVLQQIHLAPQMYMTAVAEVVRRRTFSQAFRVFASNLACQLLTVHTEEMARRREFQSKFEGHFLNTLFPGLEDTPPPFATEAPSVFDNGLPKLTATDMDSLKSQLPELALTVSSPDLNSITQFFLSKILTETCSDTDKDNKEVGTSEEGGGMRIESSTKEQSRTRASILTDRGGFESETDTEEFEKIGQVTGDSKPGSFDSVKQQRQKQLEENLGSTREEVERLRSILKTMKAVVCEALTSVREDLSVLKDRSNSESSGLFEMTERIRETLSLYSRECDRRLREREQELTVDHELELADVKKLMEAREEEIRTIKNTLMEKETELSEHERLAATMRQKLEDGQSEMRTLQTRLHQQLEDSLEQTRIYKVAAAKTVDDKRYLEMLSRNCFHCQKRIRELEENLAAAKSEQDRAVKETTDKLQMEYKTELETIRSRFKLMAASTMERSPSDSSLEKVERPDVIEIANHEAILAQAKEDMKIEKSEAILTAMEEKEREVDMYRMREAILTDKCKRYKTTIRRLSKSENVVRQTLNEKVVDNLDSDSVWLDTKIVAERAKLYEQKESGAAMMMENPLRKEFSEEISQTCHEEALKCAVSDKDDVEVSGSKKVRLESDDEAVRMSRTLELLEKDNKRLNNELQTTRESKEAAEAKVEALEADKVRLEVELVKERRRRGYVGESSSSSEDRDKDMTASVAVVAESSYSKDAATSPAEPSRRSAAPAGLSSSTLLRDKIGKMVTKLVQQNRVTINRCSPGDIVLIFWDHAHENYALFQESTTLYFLNSDCVPELDLVLNPDGTPRRHFAIAEVVHKEYCHARKTENRYRVPHGTKFYRVRVKAIEDTVDTAQMMKSQQQHQ